MQKKMKNNKLGPVIRVFVFPKTLSEELSA